MRKIFVPVYKKIFSSRLTRQFGTLLGGRFLAAGVQAISIYLLAQWATISDFGMFAAALGIVTTLQAIGDAGASTFVVREAAARGFTRCVAYAEILSRLTTGILALLCLVSIVYGSVFWGSKYFSLLPMVGWLVVDRASDIRSAIARGLGDVSLGTRNIVFRRVMQLLIFILIFKAGIDVLWAYSLGLLFGSAFAFLLMKNKLCPSPNVSFRWRALALSFIRCRPYWVHSATIQLRNIDVAIVAALAGATEAALYGVGSRLMSPLRMVPTTLATALLPYLVKRVGVNVKNDMKFGVVVSAVMSLPYIFIIFLSPWLMKKLGAGYVEATVPLQVLCVGLAGSAFISIFNSILQANKRAQVVATISIVSTLLFVLFVSVGSSFFGAVGAAVGAVIATFIQAFLVVKGAKNNV